MRDITLQVNGKTVRATVEPRTHLADFLREQLLLTGTHIGCEHGICGACTVVIQGEIARSCITYAVQCDGAEITTIEGFDDDPLMTRLRDAFTREHGLQCGYCTPGMLIAARDLVRRLGPADEQRIRLELSGNLCRCTGYMGIVAAVRRVMAEEPDLTILPPSKATVGPAPGAEASATAQLRQPSSTAPSKEPLARPKRRPLTVGNLSDVNLTTLSERFSVPHPPDKVWAFLQDLRQVAGCLPGAAVTAQEGDILEGEIRVKLGPITSTFAGEGRIIRDEAARHTTVIGRGRDARSATRAKGRVDYSLKETPDGGTEVAVELGYALAGALAQFGRKGIVVDLVNRLTQEFARNIAVRLSGGPATSRGDAGAQDALDAGSLFWSALWARIKDAVKRLLGRR